MVSTSLPIDGGWLNGLVNDAWHDTRYSCDIRRNISPQPSTSSSPS